ncbi:hypothetical protein pdam_00008747 [Pocillopora damicornis]|uniref:Uncharacterized protein n=1 Tax=Pocillopora damicornis TaxID=46731 RepID=A0A3M6UAK8_POCDA|nr:hypothetical protein pdam_00008747 [Pocillopora damicornis]
MAEGRFASVYSVEEFILEHENKNTAQKTERDVRLLERFLKTKDEDRKIEDIPAAELNEFISEFIISVRTKVRHTQRQQQTLLLLLQPLLNRSILKLASKLVIKKSSSHSDVVAVNCCFTLTKTAGTTTNTTTTSTATTVPKS